MADGWPRLRKTDDFIGSRYGGKLSDGTLKLISRGSCSKEADKRNRDGKERDDGRYWLGTDIHLERLLRIARDRTYRMIKKLEEGERNPIAKAFLRGILKGKSFYTYYVRAGDPSLFTMVTKLRRDLMRNSVTSPATKVHANKFTSC
jgi:hypothetical protein